MPDLQSTLFAVIALVTLGFALGVAGVLLVSRAQRRRRMRRIERLQERSIRNPDYGQRQADRSESNRPGTPTPPGVFVVESITIRNFKNIGELSLKLTRESALTGCWTCVAGINGAGKSTILQALCLILLGSELVTELGRVRLRRMLRRTGKGMLNAEIEAVVRKDGELRRLYLPLDERGVDEDLLREQPDYELMRATWRELRRQVLVSYGASRNVSEYKDPRHSNISPAVQRQMTLFDPLTQIASIDVLLEGGRDAAPAMETLYYLLSVVLASERLRPENPAESSRLRFALHDTTMDVIDLPDGFRSTVAWMADLCTAWHAQSETPKVSTDPSSIEGIVLLDEIGLHLHPGLEKTLVPQLRKALPKVQFIVTTHSPMVLSSFDRSELVVLDASSPTGTRELDRQVFGFTMDDVYAWLMDTAPSSQVMDDMLAESSDPELAVFLYQSKDVSEAGARKIIAERESQIAELRRKAGRS